MLCNSFCAACIGLSAVTVTVEIDISPGIGFHIVGLPDNAVKESLLRVTTALRSYGYHIPGRRVVINLAPADIRKEGSSFDLAIAVGMLAASEQINAPKIRKYIIMGELALDGSVRNVPCALPVAVHAKEEGFDGCIFPKESAREASDISEIKVYGVNRLMDVIDILSDDIDMERFLIAGDTSEQCSQSDEDNNDFCQVKGQQLAKRGLEIAAAGGHNLLLVGSPGCGKTFMASCLPSILPRMNREESIETDRKSVV